MDSRFVFTKAKLDTLPLPEAGKRNTYHDEKQPGLQLRVTSNGAKSFGVLKRPAGGQPERVTLGKYPAMTIEQARAAARDAINKLVTGTSPAAAKRALKAEQAAKKAMPTLAEAVADYVKKARRAKDDLPLKERTQGDYLAMVKAGRTMKNGRETLPGVLYPLAGKRLPDITADDLRETHEAAQKRGRRIADYGMILLRAVFGFNEIPIPENVFAKKTSRQKRIVLLPPQTADERIREEDRGRWWAALSAMDGEDVAYIKFVMLTGCRAGEPLKITVADIDTRHREITLLDTKTRTNHTLLLSRQAWAIVEKQMTGKASADKLFHVPEAWKTVAAIRQATGIHFHCKMLRSTFAQIADPLVSGSTLRGLMNHAPSGVTEKHYAPPTEAQLRAGWQAVADWLDEQATIATASNVSVLPTAESA